MLTWFVLLISRKHRHLPDQVYAATGRVLLVFIMIERCLSAISIGKLKKKKNTKFVITNPGVYIACHVLRS